MLITKDWKIWRIDFTRAFRLQHELKNAKDLVQCDRQVLTKLRQLNYDQVFDATKPYLTKDEVKALIARRDKIVAYFESSSRRRARAKCFTDSRNGAASLGDWILDLRISVDHLVANAQCYGNRFQPAQLESKIGYSYDYGVTRHFTVERC